MMDDVGRVGILYGRGQASTVNCSATHASSSPGVKGLEPRLNSVQDYRVLVQH